MDATSYDYRLDLVVGESARVEDSGVEGRRAATPVREGGTLSVPGGAAEGTERLMLPVRCKARIEIIARYRPAGLVMTYSTAEYRPFGSPVCKDTKDDVCNQCSERCFRAWAV
jgi:hypothetical protein